MMNDAAFDPPAEEYEHLVLGVARAEIGKDAVIDFFREHVPTRS